MRPRCHFQPIGPIVLAPRSLTFTSAQSQTLNIQGKTSVNQQSFTIAFWFKRASLGDLEFLTYFGDGTTTKRVTTFFNSNNTFGITGVTSSVVMDVETNTSNKIADTTSWHHLCFAIDTNQAVAANRVKIYLDGNLITGFATATYPALGRSLSNNFVATYEIGGFNGSFFNGEMTEFYYIDGQQLTPMAFITGTPGLPNNFLGVYTGSFDCYLNFRNRLSLSALGLDSSGENNNWSPNNMTVANQSLDYPS